MSKKHPIRPCPECQQPLRRRVWYAGLETRVEFHSYVCARCDFTWWGPGIDAMYQAARTEPVYRQLELGL